MAVGRKEARDAIATFIAPPNVDGINQVFTSFPKRIDFQVNALPSDVSRCAAVIFIESERENRLAIGGATNGIKRVDYSVAIQLFHHSMQRDAEDAMDDFDNLIDAIKERLRQGQHTLGEIDPNLIWQAAEPFIDVSYSEPLVRDNGATDIWAAIRFTVTQMIES